MHVTANALGMSDHDEFPHSPGAIRRGTRQRRPIRLSLPRRLYDGAAVFRLPQELMQAGVKRIVFLDWWPGTSSPEREWVLPQYRALVEAFVEVSGGAFVRLELPEEQQADRTTRQLARRQELDARRERLGRTSPSV